MSEVKKYFENPFFGKWKGLPDKQLISFFKAEKHFLKLNIKKNSIILDVGCGAGDSIEPIAGKVKKAYGIDFAENLLKAASKTFAKNSNVFIINANAETLPFPNSAFDYVTCMGNTFGNLENPDKCLEEMKRVMKSNGKIILSVYSKNALKMQLRTYKAHGVNIEFYNKDVVRIKEGLTSHRYSKKQLNKFAKKHDFNVVIIKPTQVSYILILARKQQN